MDKNIFSYQGAKQVLTQLAILTLLQGVAIIIQAMYLAKSISSLFRGDLFRYVTDDLAIFLLALSVRQLLVVLKKNIAYHFAAHTSRDIREKLLLKLFKLGPRFVKEEGSGQTVTLVMEGTAKHRRYLEIFFPKIINVVFLPVMICFYLFFENFRSAIILILAFPLVIAFMILLGKAAKSKADRQFQSYSLLSNHFVDSLRGLETLRYLGLSQKHVNKIAFVSEQYRVATMGTLRVAFLSSFALDFFTMLSIATVAVFLGLGLINGQIELQTALTILILAPEYFLPIREVGADYHATLDGKNAGKRVSEILGKEETTSNQEPFAKWNSNSKLSVRAIGVSFTESDKPSLQDISFSVTGSKKIGIIGASGSGKSSLIDLLSGFLRPSVGEFQVNDKRTGSLAFKGWQDQLIYIPQHPYLFHDTVDNNIRFYHLEASKDEVNNAALKAGLCSMIDMLPRGLDTVVGEGGRMLSGGQEQRIAIARAFLGNRPILLLDEPTAHLDIETEAELKETMLPLFENKLVFFATHRLHWMLDMDEIIVLDQGRLVEYGTHEELYNKGGKYFQLVSKQMEGSL